MPEVGLVARARAALVALLPRGRAFLVHEGTPLVLLMETLARELARGQERVADLRGEALPSESVELLSEWESDLGLPDPLLPAPTSIAQRQAMVAAKLLDSFGHTEADIRAIAAALGYFYLFFTRFSPFECGESECGESLDNDRFSHVVLITLPRGTLDAAAQAAILKVKRAHADFFFEFTDAFPLGELPLELG